MSTAGETAGQAGAKLDLGEVGIWSSSLRFCPGNTDGAVELESLGFKTAWIPGGVDSGVLQSLDTLLDATSTLKFATGIINIWRHEPADLARWWRGQTPERQGRLLLGLGVSHGPLIGANWGRPLATMRAFLDGLDAAGLPRDRLCLAALGPKMLQLAADRTAGAHPYMASTRHTAIARKILGPKAILAPEQGVVLETDPDKARPLARAFVGHYAALPNYVNNWRRDGFDEADIETLSDRLVDALIVWGDLDAIRARVQEHLAAGADQVCLQVIGGDMMDFDLARDGQAWRKLAALLAPA